MANGNDYTQEVSGVDVQVLPINGIDFVSVTDAVQISEFSRAYINKLLNGEKIAGMQLPGLGWLVSIESLNEFSASNRRAPGKSTMINQALKLFHEELGEGVHEQWLAVEEATIAAYKAKKEAATEEAEVADEAAE